jgi:hypothetical protein
MLTLFLASWLSSACAPTRSACTCFPPADPRTPAEARRYVEGATAVFDGVVVRISHPSLQEAASDEFHATTLTVTLHVKRQWRGVATDSIVVTTSMFAEACGVDFEVGRSYFVIADAVEGREKPLSITGPWLNARSCGTSRPSTRARNVERLLDAP